MVWAKELAENKLEAPRRNTRRNNGFRASAGFMDGSPRNSLFTTPLINVVEFTSQISPLKRGAEKMRVCNFTVLNSLTYGVA